MRTLRIKEVTLKAGDGSSLFEFTYFISRDVSNHVSLSDSVGRGLSQVLSVGGESCLLSSDGVRDSAGYGHRSILNHAYTIRICVEYTYDIHQAVRYSAWLHRHGSSADRGTSRHSGRCDWIVSRIVSIAAGEGGSSGRVKATRDELTCRRDGIHSIHSIVDSESIWIHPN